MNIESKSKWLTNTHKQDLSETLQALGAGVFVGEPLQTSVYSTEELKQKGFVGLYRFIFEHATLEQ